MISANTLAMVGLPRQRDDLIVLLSNRHLALEKYQNELLLGAAKGTLVAWVFLALLALLGGRLVLGSLRIEGTGSRAAALAARHDLLAAADPDAARTLRRLGELWRNPARRERLLRHPDWQKLLEKSGWRSALGRGADAAGDRSAEARDKAQAKAAELLDERELRALLDKLEAEK